MPTKPLRARSRARSVPSRPPVNQAYLLRRPRSPEMLRVLERVPSLAYLAESFSPPICKQAVSRWDRVPVNRVREVSAITGIPAYEIRPDIFERPIIVRVPAPKSRKAG